MSKEFVPELDLTAVELAEIRVERLGMSQAQLAEYLHLTRQTIAEYENESLPIKRVVALAVRHMVANSVRGPLLTRARPPRRHKAKSAADAG